MCISLRLMHKKSYWGGRAEKKEIPPEELMAVQDFSSLCLNDG